MSSTAGGLGADFRLLRDLKEQERLAEIDRDRAKLAAREARSQRESSAAAAAYTNRTTPAAAAHLESRLHER